MRHGAGAEAIGLEVWFYQSRCYDLVEWLREQELQVYPAKGFMADPLARCLVTVHQLRCNCESVGVTTGAGHCGGKRCGGATGYIGSMGCCAADGLADQAVVPGNCLLVAAGLGIAGWMPDSNRCVCVLGCLLAVCFEASLENCGCLRPWIRPKRRAARPSEDPEAEAPRVDVHCVQSDPELEAL